MYVYPNTSKEKAEAWGKAIKSIIDRETAIQSEICRSARETLTKIVTSRHDGNLSHDDAVVILTSKCNTIKRDLKAVKNDVNTDKMITAIDVWLAQAVGGVYAPLDFLLK